MKKTTYKLSDIKPIGNFDSVLETLDIKVTEIEKEGYSKRVANAIKVIVAEMGLLDVLSQDLKDGSKYEGWNKEEQKICLLFTHLLIIRLNNIAQKHLNGIDMDPNHIQLMESVSGNHEYKNIFGKLTITI
jgi:hypothetical protein